MVCLAFYSLALCVSNKYIMCVIIYITCNSDCLLIMVSPTDSESESGCHSYASLHGLWLIWWLFSEVHGLSIHPTLTQHACKHVLGFSCWVECFCWVPVVVTVQQLLYCPLEGDHLTPSHLYSIEVITNTPSIPLIIVFTLYLEKIWFHCNALKQCWSRSQITVFCWSVCANVHVYVFDAV